MTSRGSVVVDLKFDRASVASALKGAFADREVINLAEPENRNRNLSSAHYAVIWKPDEDLFRRASGHSPEVRPGLCWEASTREGVS